jgi:glutamate---cysteine ligase / carboxylate-amine ligase
MSADARLHAFSAYGIELEYMIVDKKTLSVKPLAGTLLNAATEEGSVEADKGLFGWSNEMVEHLVELKNRQPIASLPALAHGFQREVEAINTILAPVDACLMPTAMHPWMDPRTETCLWQRDNAAIYRTYERIFNTRTHGWANLQSMQLNIPFADDAEFARLHAAIRLVLPILPALAASSPIAERHNTGYADYRLHVYADNAAEMPSIAGSVIPENADTRKQYERDVLAPMYRDIAPLDSDGILRYEWLNSRGAIPRFDRYAIEIRTIDLQECPAADVAIAAATNHVVQMLYDDKRLTLPLLQAVSTPALLSMMQACARHGEQATIEDAAYLELLRYPATSCTAHALWDRLLGNLFRERPQSLIHQPFLEVILEQGTLSRRILRALDGDYSPSALHSVYGELCTCLHEGRSFEAK